VRRESDEEVKRRETQMAEAVSTDVIIKIDAPRRSEPRRVAETPRLPGSRHDYFIAMFPYKQDREMPTIRRSGRPQLR
jgi:hypothetical protein